MLSFKLVRNAFNKLCTYIADVKVVEHLCTYPNRSTEMLDVREMVWLFQGTHTLKD